MAKITVSITKSDNGSFTVKCGTSAGGGQEKAKDQSLDDVKDFIGGIIERMDEKGLIGRK
ncbi:MAG: hypothetical protein IJK26_09285 [Clostridia bacterium]|nr:hypothetical protein [Clostridia bacterium]